MKIIKPFSPIFHANRWLINRRGKMHNKKAILCPG